MSLRLIFMGSPAFAVPTLRALAAAGHEIAAVYCQPPRAAGRGMDLRKTDVQLAAEAMGLPVRHPLSLKPEDEAESFAALQADAAVVVAYGLLLPPAILSGTRLGAFNLHPSLLPRWRGAAPLQRAIMAGDAETGVAVMRMEAGLDTGPICLEERFALDDSITAAELHDRLAERGAALMVAAMAKLPDLACRPQAETGVEYAAKISKAEARVDFTRPARAVLRHVHGLSPFPGGWCLMAGQRVKILKAELAPGEGKPGTLLDDDLAIACGQGAIRPLLLQREGKQAMARDVFLRGLGLPRGAELG